MLDEEHVARAVLRGRFGFGRSALMVRSARDWAPMRLRVDLPADVQACCSCARQFGMRTPRVGGTRVRLLLGSAKRTVCHCN